MSVLKKLNKIAQLTLFDKRSSNVSVLTRNIMEVSKLKAKIGVKQVKIN